VVSQCAAHVSWWNKEEQRDRHQSDVSWQDAHLLSKSSTNWHGSTTGVVVLQRVYSRGDWWTW